MNDIKNLDDLLIPKLGANKKIKNVEIVKPPAQGVGSVMLKVKVVVQDDNGKEEILYLVGKKIPEGEDKREAFDIQRSFKKEVAFYQVIIPNLKKFQEEEGGSVILNNFAKFYGARLNLNGSEVVDEDAVMLLEDLSREGYVHSDKAKGFDLSGAKKILQDLAKFHGTTIALKIKRPQIFETDIRPLCSPFHFAKNPEIQGILKFLADVIKTIPDCSHVAELATNFFEKDTPTDVREPFGTIAHTDLWTNNFLNKIEKGEVVRNILIDFQIYGYRSHASDAFFFLWTSVRKEVLEVHFDELLKHYHNSLRETLNHFKVDISKFTFENFEEELRIEADYEFRHAFLFVFLVKYVVNIEDAVKNKIKVETSSVSPELEEMFHFMITESLKRGWLY